MDMKDGVGARRVLVPSLLFIASFSAIFILLGLSATVLGSALKEHKAALTQIGGLADHRDGRDLPGEPFVSVLNREWHSETLMRLAGRGGPLIAGRGLRDRLDACTSITLGAILTQAAISSSAAHGALLLAFYSAGLAIPFLLIALAFERMTGALGVVRRHFPVVIAVGGAVMIAARAADRDGGVHDAQHVGVEDDPLAGKRLGRRRLRRRRRRRAGGARG